jgi:hypothetical protein
MQNLDDKLKKSRKKSRLQRKLIKLSNLRISFVKNYYRRIPSDTCSGQTKEMHLQNVSFFKSVVKFFR